MSSKVSETHERLKNKLDHIKKLLDTTTTTTDLASIAIINSVATSDEIAKELKEILILLHTTVVTELTEARLSNFKVNLVIVDTAEEIIRLQNELIERLTNLESKHLATIPKTPMSFFKLYKVPISILMLIIVMWELTVLDSNAMEQVFNKLPMIFRGVK